MTKKEKTKKLIFIIFLLIICLVLIYIYRIPQPRQNRQNLLNTQQVLPVKNVVTLEINGIKYENEISEEISVYDFMYNLRTKGEIDFKEKTYSGMGKFIEEINGIKNGESYWIYYINGEKANIGVSNYKINEGDIISWRYEKNY